MNNQKLLFRIQPKARESFQGYVERLAFCNHVRSNDLLLFSKEILKYPATDEHQKEALLSLIEALTGLNGLRGLFDLRSIPKEYKTLFDYDFKKVCLSCLDDCAYFKDVWSFRNYVVCAEHRTPLSSNCNYCGAMINFESVIQKKCNQCAGHLRAPRLQQKIHEPISEYIFNVFEGDERSLTKIANKVKQLQPYIRLFNKGRFDNIESLRKSNLTSFASLQASSAELMFDEDKSVDTLSTYLASKVNKGEWSKALNGFREVISNPSEFKFAGVMKRTILERTNDIGDGAMSFDLLAKILQLNVSKLTLAIQESVPDEMIIKTGRHKISCSNFTKYQELIFAAYSKSD